MRLIKKLLGKSDIGSNAGPFLTFSSKVPNELQTIIPSATVAQCCCFGCCQVQEMWEVEYYLRKRNGWEKTGNYRFRENYCFFTNMASATNFLGTHQGFQNLDRAFVRQLLIGCPQTSRPNIETAAVGGSLGLVCGPISPFRLSFVFKFTISLFPL